MQNLTKSRLLAGAPKVAQINKVTVSLAYKSLLLFVAS